MLNDERGVLLEVEGAVDAVETFARRMVGEAPPLANVEGVVRDDAPVTAKLGVPDRPVAGRWRGAGAGRARHGDLRRVPG